MKRLTGVLLVAVVLGAMAPPAAADAPTPMPFSESFVDADPCTEQLHTVAVDVVFWVHEHGDRVVARGDRNLQTSSGYSGRGTSSFVFNGQVEVFRLTDILSREDGHRLRATVVFVLDLTSDTVRVDRFELTCVR